MTITTPEDLMIMQERIRISMGGPRVDALSGEDLADPGPESELQKKIRAHAKAQGWPCLSFPQTEKLKRFLTPGWSDITLAIPGGRTLYLELKSAKKRELREKQKLMRLMLTYLGHEYHKVKSFRRYLQITEAKGE